MFDRNAFGIAGSNGFTRKVAGWILTRRDYWQHRHDELCREAAESVELGFDVDSGNVFFQGDEPIAVAFERLVDELRTLAHRGFKIPRSRLDGIDFRAIAEEIAG